MAREGVEVKLHDSLESLNGEKCPEKREARVIQPREGAKKFAYVRSAEHARSEYARQIHGVEVYPVETPPTVADIESKVKQMSPEELAKLKAMLA